jgi:hypothetical protein
MLVRPDLPCVRLPGQMTRSAIRAANRKVGAGRAVVGDTDLQLWPSLGEGCERFAEGSEFGRGDQDRDQINHDHTSTDCPKKLIVVAVVVRLIIGQRSEYEAGAT